MSLGTVPDFSYSGEGVRLSGVTPGSPAQKAGLKEGDLLLEINDSEISSLRALSAVLKSLAPGDEIVLSYRRDGVKHEVKATLEAR